MDGVGSTTTAPNRLGAAAPPSSNQPTDSCTKAAVPLLGNWRVEFLPPQRMRCWHHCNRTFPLSPGAIPGVASGRLYFLCWRPNVCSRRELAWGGTEPRSRQSPCSWNDVKRTSKSQSCIYKRNRPHLPTPQREKPSDLEALAGTGKCVMPSQGLCLHACVSA